MPTLPREFADLLTPAGLRVLEGRSALAGALLDPPTRFVASPRLIDHRQATRVLAVLERSLRPTLEEMALPIPPQTITEMTANYAEWLPKTGRVLTAYLDRRRSPSYRRAEEVGLVALLQSESFGRFATALAGRHLRRRWGMQVLCYRTGDYADRTTITTRRTPRPDRATSMCTSPSAPQASLPRSWSMRGGGTSVSASAWPRWEGSPPTACPSGTT